MSRLNLTSPVSQSYRNWEGYPDNFKLKKLTYKSVKPLWYLMPIPIDYVDIVLKHYKYRIEQFPLNEKVKALASASLKQDLTELQGKIDAALQERSKIAKQEWMLKYEDILKAAKAQFKSDSEKFQKTVTEELPNAELEKLHLIQRWVATDTNEDS
jgi:hypothetical protein